jgi:hypothetical protein
MSGCIVRYNRRVEQYVFAGNRPVSETHQLFKTEIMICETIFETSVKRISLIPAALRNLTENPAT